MKITRKNLSIEIRKEFSDTKDNLVKIIVKTPENEMAILCQEDEILAVFEKEE